MKINSILQNAKLFLIGSCVNFICSCENIENTIKGSWTIESIHKNNVDLSQYLYSNGITFKQDHTCSLPISSLNERYSSKETGKWIVYSKNGVKYLQIVTDNENFRGEYSIMDVRTIRDTISLGQMIKLKLLSDSTVIHCARAKL